MAVFRMGIRFTREQLLNPEYDPIAQGDVDIGDLRTRYEDKIDLNHAAAVRGILVKDQKSHDWTWIWGIGLLHDEMVRESGHQRLYARYRKQYPLLPRIEFEAGADVNEALAILLRETPIEKDDRIIIESKYRNAMSIMDYLGSRS